MKTTIEIPDSLVKRAKIVAAERRTTLRALVVDGLEQVLSADQVSARARAERLFEEMDKLPVFNAGSRLSRSAANER